MAVGRLTERTGPDRTGPALAYDRAARAQRRRLPVPTGSGVRTRRTAGGLRGMEFVRSADTCRLLQTLEQLSGLSLSLAVLREQ